MAHPIRRMDRPAWFSVKFVIVVVAVSSAGAAIRTRAFADVTEIESVSTAGQQGNDISGRYTGPAISGNGLVVAFDSMASTLVQGDTNNAVDVFVHDRETGVTERVSVSSAGLQGNGISTRPAIDGDGDVVTFDSAASNLVAGDTNGALDVFVHTRSTQATERVSVSSGGVQGNGASYSPTISADGRYVCFVSAASNLVPNDTNNVEDIFVRDRVAGTTERVDIDSNGQQANSSSTLAAISADGRWVTFISYANNLVQGDTNDQFDVFIHDRQTGLTERVSVDSNGQQANGLSSGPSVSADGRYVAFWSDATNLVPDDTNARRDIFVRDRAAQMTERVSVSSLGVQGDGDSQTPGVRGYTASGPQITPDGRYVVFYSAATNLVPGDTNVCGPVFQNPPGRCPDVFVRDRTAGTTTRVSVAGDGTQADDASIDASISGAGAAVAFFSIAGNLVSNDTNSCPPGFPPPLSCPDIFAHESTGTSSADGQNPDASPVGLFLATRPNPAGMSVELSAAGVDPSDVSLVIYDFSGRVVRTLVRGRLAGDMVIWDGRDDQGRRVETGIYFCRLASAGRIATGRITMFRN